MKRSTCKRARESLNVMLTLCTVVYKGPHPQQEEWPNTFMENDGGPARKMGTLWPQKLSWGKGIKEEAAAEIRKA